MKTIRVIPRIDIKGPNLVKGIHLEGLRVLGSPEQFAKFYYENGADELFYQDVVASLYERNSLNEIITKTAKESFIPLTVGGGLRTIEDMKTVLRAGADKIAINTAAIKNPEIIRKAAKEFGSSTIVVAIEAIKNSDSNYLAYVDNGRDYTGVEVLEWARKVEDLGAGEVLITSVDNEGTGSGFDMELTHMIATNLSIPVIAHGGAGSPSDVADVVVEGKADAVAVASILHYEYIRHNELFTDKGEGNIEFLRSKREMTRFETGSIYDIKYELDSRDIMCRQTNEESSDNRP